MKLYVFLFKKLKIMKTKMYSNIEKMSIFDHKKIVINNIMSVAISLTSLKLFIILSFSFTSLLY